MDDEFDLLGDPPAPTPPHRPMWLLLGALVLVALLAVVGVVWMVSSVSDRGGRVTAAASSAAPTTPPTTPPATSEPVPTTVPPLPSTTAAAPTATVTIPVLSATVAPPPTPKPSTKPAPKPTPVPRPTLSKPAGKLVAVPDVVGLRVQPAASVLTAAGLKVQVLGGVLVVDRDQRRVTAQRPTPGTVVRAGSTVILVTDGL